MYATVSHDVSAGSQPVENLRQALADLFKDRKTCDLLSDTFVCEVTNTEDYLLVVKDLKQLGTAFKDQFQYVITLHRAGDALRSNGSFSKPKARSIIGGDE